MIANTKGFTGHAMGVGIEDVVAVKALETGIVPPVANFREPDPELGPLNLSQGRRLPGRYALRLAAGFGSQISMTAAALDAGADGRAGTARGARLRLPDRRRGGVAALARPRERRRPTPDLEVVQHRLRVVDPWPPSRPSPAPAIAAGARPAGRGRGAGRTGRACRAVEPVAVRAGGAGRCGGGGRWRVADG